jgi:c(7)-type cytochrome triheme protein
MRGRAWSIMMTLAMVTIGGCSPEIRYRVLSGIFEEVPRPGEEVQPKPVVRKTRRPETETASAPLPSDTDALPEIQPVVLKRDWREVLRQLPKEAAGGVDWNEALKEKLIEPKAGLGAENPDQPVFDMNVELIPEGQPVFKVTFPHKEHTQWLACANCHPGIFQMQRGADPITMAKIFAGEYCGRCHGKVSFNVATGCPRCHLALAGPK